MATLSHVHLYRAARTAAQQEGRSIMATTTTETRAIRTSDAAKLRNGDKLTFVGPITNDKPITRTVHIDNTNGGNAYVVVNRKDYVIGASCFMENAIVAAINGKPYTAPEVAPEASNASAEELAAIHELIKLFKADGNDEAVDALMDMAAKVALGERKEDKKAQKAIKTARAEKKAQPKRNPNKAQRASKQAPAPIKKGNGPVRYMPAPETCNTVDPLRKNYVDPRMFSPRIVRMIESAAAKLAAECGHDVRVYLRGSWAWIQPVHVEKGYGRGAEFAAACKALPHGKPNPKDESAAARISEKWQHSPRRGQCRRAFEL